MHQQGKAEELIQGGTYSVEKRLDEMKESNTLELE
jgi:hypothetical protein